MQSIRTSAGDRTQRRRGFTLIELLAVISIIVILIGLIMAGAGFASRSADRNRCRADMQKIAIALDEFMAVRGAYIPASVETPMTSKVFSVLTTFSKDLLPTNATSSGPSFVDPWGNSFYYSCPNKRTYTMRSYGPDGKSGGTPDDDLSNQRGGN